jgi:hypothetical protein
MRFTARDPVRGKQQNPLTLHPYLYCQNDSINKVDLDGRWAFLFGGSLSGNITASDFSNGFNNKYGLGGIGALIAHNSVILPAMTMLSDHFSAGGTLGAGFVVAWDHTKGWKSLTDSKAWSYGTMQWGAGGASWSSGMGGSITCDVGISNATHVSQLAGRFVEGGGSVTIPNGFTIGGSVSWGINPDETLNGIWLGTINFGGGTRGWEGHGYVGNAWVQEYNF